jgi:hypothetical protein
MAISPFLRCTVEKASSAGSFTGRKWGSFSTIILCLSHYNTKTGFGATDVSRTACQPPGIVPQNPVSCCLLADAVLR